MTGDDAIAVMQSVIKNAEERQQQVSATELRLMLTKALVALRSARGSNGVDAGNITIARQAIREALKAA